MDSTHRSGISIADFESHCRQDRISCTYKMKMVSNRHKIPYDVPTALKMKIKELKIIKKSWIEKVYLLL